MEITIQIKSILGKVIFESKKESNTIKKTISEVIKNDANLSYAGLSYADLSDANLSDANLSDADLRGANLSDANLRGADLSYANLSDANLRDANLRGANLRGANLRGADLSYANLSDANLRGADLSDANLRGADLSDADLRGANLSDADNVPMYCKWSHGLSNGNLIQIGCKKKTINEWDDFFNSENIFETKRGTDDFKQIQAIFEAYKAYLNFLNN